MTQYYEAEVIVGIEDIVINELKGVKGVQKQSIKLIRDGFIRFEFKNNPTKLLMLNSIIAIYAIHYFDIPRPKAFLGHENFTHMVKLLSSTYQEWDEQTVTFGIGAAGSDSSVMQRIKQDISQALNLPIADDDKGNLYIRLLPAYQTQGWEVLIRLTPHPLATRKWRIQNIPGALNATVAYAMTQLANISHKGYVINLCSGTATILIEHAKHHSYDTMIAIDNNKNMLQAASQNINASNINSNIIQLLCDVQQTPFSTNSIGCIYADLPFGHHIGSHNENEWLYPAILEESARIAKQGATFVILTHEIQLMEQTLESSHWKTKLQKKINLSGLHPQIFVLERF
jgi:tRNA (guanine6-N2)-methyltransferase